MIGFQGNIKGKISENIKNIFSIIIRGVELELGIHAKESGIYISCVCFISGRLEL